jgi:hypothetical protein
MVFDHNFDGFEVDIGKLLMSVIEQSIAKACRLVVGGEQWWKKEDLVTKFVNQFFLPDKKKLDWIKGVPHSWIR